MPDSRQVAGLDVEEVIQQVKEAITLSQRLDYGDGPDVQVKEVQLTLKAYVQTGGGAEFKLKIPFINQDFGLTGGASEEETHTVQLVFVPATPKSLLRPIKTQLVEGISAVRRSLRAAAAGDIPLDLKTASVSLDFVLDEKGQISLVVRGNLGRKWSNTVTVSLALRQPATS
jgi:hypothetical protein